MPFSSCAGNTGSCDLADGALPGRGPSPHHINSPQVFGDVGNYPPAGQGAWQGNAGGLRVNRKQVRPIDAERHRRMHLDKCFSCFDVLERGRVPSGMVWGGLALLTGAPELSKVKFILGMYDADRCESSRVSSPPRTIGG